MHTAGCLPVLRVARRPSSRTVPCLIAAHLRVPARLLVPVLVHEPDTAMLTAPQALTLWMAKQKPEIRDNFRNGIAKPKRQKRAASEWLILFDDPLFADTLSVAGIRCACWPRHVQERRSRGVDGRRTLPDMELPGNVQSGPAPSPATTASSCRAAMMGLPSRHG